MFDLIHTKLYEKYKSMDLFHFITDSSTLCVELSVFKSITLMVLTH